MIIPIDVEFVYIGTATIEEQNLDCIVGLHESYLGSALASFDSGRVLHWIDYFRQGWAEVLYHDRVWDLLSALRESVIGDRGISRIVEQVLDVAASTDDDQVNAFWRKDYLFRYFLAIIIL